MTRPGLRRDPVRLVFSATVWSSAWYLFSYLFAGTVMFAVAVTMITLGMSLSVTLAGLPVLIAAAMVLRAAATAERARLRFAYAEPVRGRYREVTGPGIIRRLATVWTDTATWRDLAYLGGCFAPLFALDCTVLGIWLSFLAGITVPLWYGRVTGACMGYCPAHSTHGIQFGSFPHGASGPGAAGLYVHTLPGALILAGICLVAFVLFSYVLVATARLHAAIARALLGAPGDPLREAKEVLRRPGPLTPPSPNERW